MAENATILWTNDDIKGGKSENLRRMIEFCDRYGIPGTFFIIPVASGPISKDAEMIRVVEEARKRGHEFQPHGYRHDAFECGIPPLMYLIDNKEKADYFDANRFAVEELHSLEGQLRMLESARREWRAAFAEEPDGFRPPWAAVCGNLYKAMAILGFRWSSGRVHGMAWKFRTDGDLTHPPQYFGNTPPGPHTISGIREYPMAADYAMKIPDDRRHWEAMVELAEIDFKYYTGRGLPFNICSHWFALEHEGGTGYRIHEILLERLLKKPGVRFVTISQFDKELYKQEK